MDISDIKGTISSPGSGLPNVHQEIVESLINNDWCRFSTEDAKQFFYAIGLESFNQYLRGDEDFVVLERPETGIGHDEGEREARSQVAGNHPNYLDRQKRRFEKETGVPLKAMADWFLNDNRDALGLAMPHSSLVSNVRLIDLFMERIGALVASMRQEGHPYQADDEDRGRIAGGKEKHYLREIGTIYRKMAERWDNLEMLSFSDPQLQEASRCYLYGFFRACVVLSAAALETKLKGTGIDFAETYSTLVEHAEKQGSIDRAHSEFARSVFRERNKVVHSNADPRRETAEEVLFCARSVLSFLHLPKDSR